jgi:hypothetical protein
VQARMQNGPDIMAARTRLDADQHRPQLPAQDG